MLRAMNGEVRYVNADHTNTEVVQAYSPLFFPPHISHHFVLQSRYSYLSQYPLMFVLIWQTRLGALNRSVFTRLASKLTSRRYKSDTTTRSSEDGVVEKSQTILTPGAVPPLSVWQQGLYPLKRGFSAYGRAQRTRPYTTQVLSSIAIYACGDVSAQYMGGDGYNPMGTLRSMIIGGIAAIPAYKW